MRRTPLASRAPSPTGRRARGWTIWPVLSCGRTGAPPGEKQLRACPRRPRGRAWVRWNRPGVRRSASSSPLSRGCGERESISACASARDWRARGRRACKLVTLIFDRHHTRKQRVAAALAVAHVRLVSARLPPLLCLALLCFALPCFALLCCALLCFASNCCGFLALLCFALLCFALL